MNCKKKTDDLSHYFEVLTRWLWWVLLPYAFNSLISNHVEFLSQNYLFHIYSWKSKRSKYSHAKKKRNENFDFSCVYFAFSCDNFYFSDFRFNILTIHFLALISMHDEKQKITNIQNGHIRLPYYGITFNIKLNNTFNDLFAPYWFSSTSDYSIGLIKR